jgi:hypothetical protein
MHNYNCLILKFKFMRKLQKMALTNEEMLKIVGGDAILTYTYTDPDGVVRESTASVKGDRCAVENYIQGNLSGSNMNTLTISNNSDGLNGNYLHSYGSTYLNAQVSDDGTTYYDTTSQITFGCPS